jgi:phospholipid/cholesterol/gamma-HCH transport system substrate-binding protein
VEPLFDDFSLGANNTLTPVTPQQGLAGLKTGQLRRCPGAGTQPAADGSSPFTNGGQISCDPSETP